MNRRLAIFSLLITCTLSLFAEDAAALHWAQFRGPNGDGISETTGLPISFGPEENLAWKTPLPPGHSSPVLSADAIFLTAVDKNALLTICLDRKTGAIRWQKEAPREREAHVDYRSSPAAASPVTDGSSVYVFFQDYGILAYDMAGNELWQHPLGPFNNVYGMGASPILVDDKLIFVSDQSTDSYIMALNKKTGEQLWRTERREAKSGHCTPVIYETESGEKQIIVPGSFLLTAYSPESGEKIWWVRGLSFEMKSTPVFEDGIMYINGYGSPLNQPGNQVELPQYEDMLAEQDADKNGVLSKPEVPDKPASDWFGFVDLDGDSVLNKDDWEYMRAALASLNGMLAIRLGGEGDMTEANSIWQYRKSVPQLPSPLLYKNILYMINDGGIATSFKPETGEVIKQGRLKGANDQYYASPVAADDKVFMVSRKGKVSVLKPDGNLEVMAVNDLGEQCYATPAIADQHIYIRTVKALYCFGEKQ